MAHVQDNTDGDNCQYAEDHLEDLTPGNANAHSTLRALFHPIGHRKRCEDLLLCRTHQL
ncbi:MAG TPA: hypothetical protein VGO93_26295 [Candidatus Xenobia bacterium]